MKTDAWIEIDDDYLREFAPDKSWKDPKNSKHIKEIEDLVGHSLKYIGCRVFRGEAFANIIKESLGNDCNMDNLKITYIPWRRSWLVEKKEPPIRQLEALKGD